MQTITVGIDIRPGAGPNNVRPGSTGTIPVAILSGGGFDATTVDQSTVKFGPAGASPIPGTARTTDVDRDGDLDLVLQFYTADTGIACGDTSASLTGKTTGGQAFQGSDSIKTVGCK